MTTRATFAARLHVLTGPLQGETLTLAPGDHTIGRDSGNWLRIADPALSRHHCTITVADGHVTITDARSANGTCVDSVAVQTRVLLDGDVIRIGLSELRVTLAPPEHESVDGVTDVAATLGEGGDIAAVPTVSISYADARYVGAAAREPAASVNARTQRDFQALLGISTALARIRESPAVQRRLLEILLEVLPASYGAVVLVDRTGEPCGDPVALRTRPGPDVAVSRTLVRRTVRERSGLLCTPDVDDVFSTAESLVGANVCAVACAPMVLGDGVEGVIYLACTEPARRLDADDLQLLIGAASIAGLALDNAIVVEALAAAEDIRKQLNVSRALVGRSAPMQAVYERIGQVAAVDASVVIHGESGTGKEVVARAIHEQSRRSGRPFVAIPCAALPDTLLESELFGYEPGAFADARKTKPGKLELARGGTVLLDEIGDTSPAFQVKILRAIQERQIERLGGTKTINLDVRFLCATHRDLEAMTATGAFREDLFYRLEELRIDLPPLRERRGDIPLIARALLAKLAGTTSRKVDGITRAALHVLQSHTWPGNVRELQQAITHALAFGKTRAIRTADLPARILKKGFATAGPRRYYDAVDASKREIIQKAIDAAGGNRTQAARALGLPKGSLHRLMAKLGMKKASQGIA